MCLMMLLMVNASSFQLTHSTEDWFVGARLKVKKRLLVVAVSVFQRLIQTVAVFSSVLTKHSAVTAILFVACYVFLLNRYIFCALMLLVG